MGGPVKATPYGRGLFTRPQHPEIESWAERTLALAEKSPNLNLKIGAISSLAYYRILTGDFGRALLAINSLKELSQSKGSTLLNQIGVETMEGIYCRYVGLFEKCLKAVSNALELSRTKGIHIFDPSLFHYGLVSALNINDPITATRLLNEMSSSMSNANPFYASFYHNAKCQEALFRRDLGAALLHVEQGTKLRTEGGFTHVTGWCHLQNAYVLHALGRHGEAADYLAQTFDFAREIKSKYLEYSALLARALFAFDRGEEASGLKSLRSALTLGGEGGYFGVWGPLPYDLARLCMKALENGIEVEFVQEIIRRHKMMPDHPPLYPENWPWPVKICVLGRFELFKDGQPVQDNRKVQKKPLLMLKALIALGGKDIDEERLMDILWPEADGDQAYSALTTTLSRLRQLLGEKVLEVQAGRVTLNPRYCWVDVWAFEGLSDKAEDLWRGSHSGDGQAEALQLMGKAVELYQGPFLSDERSKPFWALPLGERLKNRFLFLIEKLGRSLEQKEQWGQAIVLYGKGLEVDNLAEELYRRLMACYGSLGETVKAVQVYRQLKTTLASILEIEPSPKTETLYRTLTTPHKITK